MKLLLSSLGALVFLVASTGGSASDISVAYVFSVSGPWTVARNSDHDLHSGQGLRPGDVISLRRPPEKTDSLVVVGSGESIVAQRHCGTDDCRAPVKLPVTLTWEDKPFAKIFQAVMSRWYEEESRFSPVATRGDVDVLFEGVITARSSDSQLQPVVGDLSPGNYKLVWEPVPGAAQGASPKPVSTLLKVGSGMKIARAEGLTPGLYDVQAFRADASPDSDPVAEAWVLAVGDCSYQRASGLFDEAVTASGKWASAVSGDTVRRFLRADLLEIAASLPSCPP